MKSAPCLKSAKPGLFTLTIDKQKARRAVDDPPPNFAGIALANSTFALNTTFFAHDALFFANLCLPLDDLFLDFRPCYALLFDGRFSVDFL